MQKKSRLMHSLNLFRRLAPYFKPYLGIIFKSPDKETSIRIDLTFQME